MDRLQTSPTSHSPGVNRSDVTRCLLDRVGGLVLLYDQAALVLQHLPQYSLRTSPRQQLVAFPRRLLELSGSTKHINEDRPLRDARLAVGKGLEPREAIGRRQPALGCRRRQSRVITDPRGV